jgi:hypothetical protein
VVPVDPRTPWVGYLIGLAQTDGHLSVASRNRGRLSIELSSRDEDVLIRLREVIPYRSSIGTRRRTTNFKDAYESSILVVCARAFRDGLIDCGVPVGEKSRSIAPPPMPFSEPDYVRGLIDGDGSVGTTAEGLPFVSLNTSSDAIAQYFVDFIARVTGKREKRPGRNRRDDVYNICVFRQDAVRLAELLYYSNCIALDRKRSAAASIRTWRPPPPRPRICRRWSPIEDEIALSTRAGVAARELGRTVRAVYGRRVEIKKGRSRQASSR